MTNNEKIAEWLGYEIFHPVMGDAVQSMMSKAPKMQEWVPYYDKHITLWHGEAGLLAKIEERGKRGIFLEAIMIDNAWDVDGRWHPDFIWLIRRAEPAQLTAALVKMIEEEPTNDQR